MAAELIDSKLFRPPYGQINPNHAVQLKQHYKIVMWNYLSGDFDKNLDRNESLNRMKAAGPGSIMVFHDSEKARQNLEFLSKFPFICFGQTQALRSERSN